MKQLLAEVWRSDRRNFLKILFGNILVSLLGGIGIVMLIPLLNMLQIGDNRLPGWFNDLEYPVRIAVLLAAYMLLVTVKALISRRLSILESDFNENTRLRLQNRLYSSLSGADWESLTNGKNSDLVCMFTDQCGEVTYGIREVIGLLASFVTVFTQMGIAIAMSPALTGIVCVLGGCMLLAFKPLRKKSREFGDEMITVRRNFFEELYNQLSGVKEVRAYGVEKEHAALFEKVSTSFKTARMKYVRKCTVPGMVYSVSASLLIAGIYLICTLGLHVETDRLVVLVYVFARLWPLFSGFQGRVQGIASCVPAYERLEEAIREMQPEEEHRDTYADFSTWNQITFDKVSFLYKNTGSQTLKNVSFSVKRGSVVALLGHNGAGKTTAANIMMGFLFPQSGSVFIDGTLLKTENSRYWWKQTGYVPQDPLILNASVRENISRFHPQATEDDIVSALKAAMAWDFVSKLPDKLDTKLGDRGVRLSGGQRQRIVLARVLLGRPGLIVLDEATSALDWESEKAFRDIIDSMRGNAAVVLIAHRISTVLMADTAVVLENAEVSECGSVTELVHKPGSYLARMAGAE